MRSTSGRSSIVLAQELLAEADLDLLVHRRVGALEQVAERGVALLADRAVEARDRARRLAHLLHLRERELGGLGDLLVARLAAVLGLELALDAGDLALALADVHRDPDRARLVREPALDRLAHPEGRVGGELVALAPVELLGRADEAEDALLDQVEQRELLALVLLRDRDDEAQVRVDHALLGLEVALLDALGQLHLLVGGEQRIAADLVEEELQRVGGRARQLAVPEGGGLHALAAAVVRDLDAERLEVAPRASRRPRRLPRARAPARRGRRSGRSRAPRPG